MPDKVKTEDKPFDPTMSFSVFGSWFDTLERVRESQGAEVAYDLFRAIANYSMYHEAPVFDDSSILYMFWPMIEREIDLSLKRRGANFSSKETEERRQQVIAVYSENPSLSIRYIADMTGIPKSVVGRIIKNLDDASITENERETEKESEHETETERETDQETETEKEVEQEREKEEEIEIDTMGLGRDGTVGQSYSAGIQCGDIDPLMCSLSDWENLPDEVRKEFSLLDRIQARIASADWVQLEILKEDKANNYRVGRAKYKWEAAYAAWLQSITNESAVLILDKYLSTHTETATEKMWGDRYGRIIGGWDADKQEPIIVYSATGGFLQGIQHNVASVPVTYYRTEEGAAEVEEEKAWFDDLTDGDKFMAAGDDLPF